MTMQDLKEIGPQGLRDRKRKEERGGREGGTGGLMLSLWVNVMISRPAIKQVFQFCHHLRFVFLG